jgi:hypothetical protein
MITVYGFQLLTTVTVTFAVATKSPEKNLDNPKSKVYASTL